MFDSNAWGTAYPYNRTIEFQVEWASKPPTPEIPVPVIADMIVIRLFISYKGTIGVTKITVTR